MTHVDDQTIPHDLRKNFRLLYAVNLFSSAQFSLPIYMLFGVQYLGVSFLQAGALFLVSWVVSLALDFMSGGLADTYGRKKIFLFGISLQIISKVPFLLSKDYLLLIVSSVIAGIGMALVSNTLTALLYEEAKQQNQKKYFQHANATADAYGYIGRVVASVAGGAAYLLHPTIPYALTAGALLVAFAAGSLMRFSRTVESHLHDKKDPKIMLSALKVFAGNRALIKFTIITSLVCVWGDYVFTNYQPHYLDLGASPVVLGYLYAGLSLVSAVGSVTMRHLPNKFSAHTLNSIVLIGISVTPFLLIIWNAPAAYLAPIGLALVSGITMPNVNLYVNKYATNKIRSSLLSITTTAMGIGSGIGILLALNVIGKLSFQYIMLLCIAGCAVTFIANNGIRPRESVVEQSA